MNKSEIPNNFVAKTDIGSFRIKITNRDYITVGLPGSCVQIAYNALNNTANLDWLGTEKGGCELFNKEIHGNKTVIMTDLGFTILKQLYPEVNPIIKLRDSSSFLCRLPNGNPMPISLMKYKLLMTGKTYYQERFDAQLQYPKSESAYYAFVEARQNKQLFNKDYNFNNHDLNKALGPLLHSSKNWAEVFEKIGNTFGRNACVLMHAWYLDLYGLLAQEAIHTDWTINIHDRPMIHYTITERNTSKNYTRKSFQYNPYIYGGGGYYPSLISYRSVLRNPSHKGCTIKRHMI